MGRFFRTRRSGGGRDETGGAERRNRRRKKEIPQTITTFEIKPRMTDPAIDEWLDAHYVAIDSTVPLRNKLLLFLCGSYGIPMRQRLIVHVAAQMGYHVINLNYPNSWTVGGLCQQSDDLGCHGSVRMDIFDGANRSGLVAINRANSIVNRLEKLLRYLHMEYADDGWSAYLGEQGVQWQSVVVAGHSQGGGQAAIIAKHQLVERVLMLASPVDYIKSRKAHASWVSQPGATPANRYFGFVHTEDNGYEKIRRVWEMLGMEAAGPVVNVDVNDPPYGQSQCLITNYEDIQRKRYHGCVVQDAITPTLADGSLVFEPVWRYMLDV